MHAAYGVYLFKITWSGKYEEEAFIKTFPDLRKYEEIEQNLCLIHLEVGSLYLLFK